MGSREASSSADNRELDGKTVSPIRFQSLREMKGQVIASGVSELDS